jgi:hypothetical protein
VRQVFERQVKWKAFQPVVALDWKPPLMRL